MAIQPTPGSSESNRNSASTAITVCAALIALVGLAGSLYLSIGMDLKACPLCFYQRTFMMAAVAVLGLGLLLPGVRIAAILVLTLPLAVGGLAVAVFHCYLEAAGRLECPAGVLALGSAPQQSLAIYV